jgi:hypothetical protein
LQAARWVLDSSHLLGIGFVIETKGIPHHDR